MSDASATNAHVPTSFAPRKINVEADDQTSTAIPPSHNPVLSVWFAVVGPSRGVTGREA
jgi:hypothetical protein